MHQQTHKAFCAAISLTWSCVQVNSDEAGAGFAEVGALSEAKDALREAVQVPLQHPHLFQKGSLARFSFLQVVCYCQYACHIPASGCCSCKTICSFGTSGHDSDRSCCHTAVLAGMQASWVTGFAASLAAALCCARHWPATLALPVNHVDCFHLALTPK